MCLFQVQVLKDLATAINDVMTVYFKQLIRHYTDVKTT